MESNEMTALIKKYPIVSEWLQSMSSEICSHCRILKHEKGESLFRKGEQLKNIYIVCEGTIMISSGNINGNEMGIVFVSEGLSVGEMEVLLNTNELLYSAKVFTDSILLSIPNGIFINWVNQDRNACIKLAKVLAQKLYNASSSTVKNKRLEAITRVEMFISESGKSQIKETKEELAEACGVSARTIHRAIAALAEKKMLTLKNGKIEISQEQLNRIEEDILDQMDKYK